MPANSTDCHETLTLESGLPTMSAVMFALGVAGNFVALALLETRRRTNSPSLFRILVTALITTDLLGTIAVTPFVLVAYAKNTTLVAQGDRGVLCSYFGFSMTFLSLSTLSILCAMALERFIALGFPYFYDRHITSTRCGYVAIALIYLACVLFCACPLMGFGKYVQYCPGTWCFLDMSPHSDSDKIYTAFYACFTLIVIMCTSVCNLSVIHFLVKMHRRRNTHHRAGRSLSRRFFRRSLSMMEEVEHILPLIFITVAFSICSFPILVNFFFAKTRITHALRIPFLTFFFVLGLSLPHPIIPVRPTAAGVHQLHRQDGGAAGQRPARPAHALLQLHHRPLGLHLPRALRAQVRLEEPVPPPGETTQP
ncbi:prostaglandin E receptor 2b subtype EP2 isoform X2 [Gadus chalcogrammus]|uniref:prostaglandin E receptor 2b subtype EP2 isoform X2 n=1 Tax=Gadus chalcogrammus TaxID=1042646 RepID=UPI0024C49B63|nr:prostaglandin E receptor 2b subtype EP2 isoform X2 [Gadus chalcogrammus]